MKIPRDGFIAQYARYRDKYDSYDTAEYFYQEWVNCQHPKDIKFTSEFELFYALALQADGILPPVAQKALAYRVFDAISECKEKKYQVDQLFVRKPKPGRKKKGIDERTNLIFGVRDLLKQGKTKTEAYSLISDELNLAADTVRRAYERATKSSYKSKEKK